MKIGVIGSGSIGPDLAYGFVSALAGGEGGTVHLLDIKQEALDAGMERIRGYVAKGLARGKLQPKVAAKIESSLLPTMEMTDLAACDYVLEAATEELAIKQAILAQLEGVVRADGLIGFATSGLPRAQIAAKAMHPERCFVNHPFFPAWRSLPMEVVLSGDEELDRRMLAVLRTLGKVPVPTADVVCFAADDIFCNYCAEAARLFTEGVGHPEQIDRVVNDAIGGGGPFLVMDLTRGNLLNVKCLRLMEEAPTGSPWFAPPQVFSEQANTPWLDPKKPREAKIDPERAKIILDRILAVLIARSYYVVDHEICSARELNWLTRTALGFSKGLLDLAEELGAERVREICSAYAETHPGFELPPSIAAGRLVSFDRHLSIEQEDGLAIVRIQRPEVLGALNHETMEELDAAFARLEADETVRGIVLSSFDGALAGADISELAALKTPEEAADKCRHGHRVLARIAALSKPVVAAVDGPVLGGGSELSMACHARVVGKALMLGQPEVNLGIIPGYGGTQRLPRLVGFERAFGMLRKGTPIDAKTACAWGWAQGEPADDPVAAAKALIGEHLAGRIQLAAVDETALDLPAVLPKVEIEHRSLAIDAILVEVLRRGLTRSLAEGLEVEAEGFARCKRTIDYDIGMTNFIQNGPRVPATFMNE